MAKNNLVFEHDEKKSIVIALVVSAVVILALLLTFVAIKNYQKSDHTNPSGTEASGSDNTENSTEIDFSAGEVVVTNQTELNAALENTSVSSISFESEEAQTIVIPNGDYSNIAFSINGPQTEVTNYGIFASITIYQIAANTWTESVSGNSLLINSMACHLIIPSGISVKNIETLMQGSSLAIEISGSVSLLALEATDAIVSVQCDGTLGQIMLYSKSNFNLIGSPNGSIPIEVAYGADDSVLDLKVPVNVSTFSSSRFALNEGAEGSSLAITNTGCTVVLENNTQSEIRFVYPDASEYAVAAGETQTYTPEDAAVVNTGETDTGGDTSSDNTSSTGNSGGSTGTSSGGTTTIVQGYTQEQVDAMIKTAVAQATENMVSVNELNAKIQAEQQSTAQKIKEAVENATKDMISKDQVEDMVSKEDAQNLINDAVTEALEKQQEQNAEDQKEAIEQALINYQNKPMIIRFINSNRIYGGKAGAAKTYTEIKAELDQITEVIGQTSSGELYTVTVNKWNNYGSENALGVAVPYNDKDEEANLIAAGQYRFIADLALPEDCAIASGLMAEVMVVVQEAEPEKEWLVYEDNAFANGIQVTEYQIADSLNPSEGEITAYYVISNHTEKNTYVYLEYSYFDGLGQEMTQSHSSCDGKFINPGDKWIFTRTLPYDEYSSYLVTVHTYQRNDSIEAVHYEKLSIDESFSSISIERKEEASDKTLTEVTAQILFIKEGKAYGMQVIKTGKGSIPSINDEATIKKTDGKFLLNSLSGLTIPTELLLEAEPLKETVITTIGGYET